MRAAHHTPGEASDTCMYTDGTSATVIRHRAVIIPRSSSPSPTPSPRCNHQHARSVRRASRRNGPNSQSPRHTTITITGQHHTTTTTASINYHPTVTTRSPTTNPHHRATTTPHNTTARFHRNTKGGTTTPRDSPRHTSPTPFSIVSTGRSLVPRVVVAVVSLL